VKIRLVLQRRSNSSKRQVAIWRRRCATSTYINKATIKKLVVHYAVSERSCTIEREKAFPSTDGTLDGGSTGLTNSGLCVYPRDLPEIRANRRTNRHKTHSDFVWRLRLQFMPSEVKRETPLTYCRPSGSYPETGFGEITPRKSVCKIAIARTGEYKTNILRSCTLFFERACFLLRMNKKIASQHASPFRNISEDRSAPAV
jgi:hypothetical protein